MTDVSVNNARHITDVSIIVATYNPSKVKLFQTVRSILLQEATGYEIIITDDGSEVDYFADLKELFNEFSFKEYKLIKNSINKGTVKNVAHSLKYVTKRYLKCLSPGDLFYDQYSLRNWHQFMETGKKVSFSSSVYYNRVGNHLHIVGTDLNPSTLIPYRNKSDGHIDIERLKLYYLLMSDLIVGVGFMVESMLFKKYIDLITDKVIYAEDNVFRLMVLNNIEIQFYPRTTLWYEYGSGISTMNDEVWRQRLKADWEATDHLMQDMMLTMTDSFSCRFKKILDLKYRDTSRIKIKLYTHQLFPNLKFEKIRSYFGKHNASRDVENKCFFYQCL